MKVVTTVAKVLVVVGTVMMLASPGMAAGQQKRIGSGQGTGDRIRTPGDCKGMETNTDSAMFQILAARYGNGSGTGQGTMDRTRSRTQIPGQCKGIENAGDERAA